ncbi:MAG: hypothetical protein COW73_02325 [Nitrospirae bacterium CG18_big_fil_WC_8_21_14_2_50_70_55]|nr:hypothetical protein [Deltaproteobacteria bacterium]OIP65959.1 MAG: hypothetical protein AUK30_03460 [Nitrospirae bacterium CG2_30_70_394]PIQ06771.1 MAG: hypothetical protein COW73_02325 [Nitrospirae bacterium CG18_big_fil_WC_8_21_14_2_50_70_55]PIU80020.1 MAG: hypothetical protein COS73_01455 [Nitrospirae bacterium CG06_land_8_20_14_3_00_70_43]PIW83262.1 MAG: hypothetical protein COZ96_04335 [Nitrospirae bacterium CG_4_8_14_3_um_filter_70_85]PIX82575.1 MAG: hypothetical protein COZ33_09945 
MHLSLWMAVVAGFAGVALASPVVAADSCVTCHGDASWAVKNKKLFDYYQQWQGSVHGLNGVTCVACHGGNAAATEKSAAHGGDLAESNPQSAIYYGNIPELCGSCHQGVASAFAQSKHAARVKVLDGGPTCVTCHGSLNTEILSPLKIAAVCERCHNDATGNHPAIPGRASEVRRDDMMSEAFLHWAVAYYEAIGQPQALAAEQGQLAALRVAWHTFDLDQVQGGYEVIVKGLRDRQKEIQRAKVEAAKRAARSKAKDKTGK